MKPRVLLPIILLLTVPVAGFKLFTPSMESNQAIATPLLPEAISAFDPEDIAQRESAKQLALSMMQKQLPLPHRPSLNKLLKRSSQEVEAAKP